MDHSLTMKLDIPYYSQIRDVKNPEWKKRACGVVTLLMVLKFFKKDITLSVDDLIIEGLAINAHNEHGWIHDGLVALARNYGAHAYCQEFKSRLFDAVKKIMTIHPIEESLTEDGIKKIVETLRSGAPVIASVLGKFNENGEYHLVPLVGFEEKDGVVSGFYYHEPNAERESEGAFQFVDIATFRQFWRKFAIFIYEAE